MDETYDRPTRSEVALREVVPADVGALQAIIQGEIDTQISTAKRFPRDVHRALAATRDMAALTQDVAGECYYRLERRGRNGQRTVIQGPSARFAEILASNWGNCRIGARLIEEGDRFVTAQGAFMDLERNVAITYEIRRRITDQNGNRYSDDMVAVTANAACSIALRNAVLKGIPKAFWEPALKEAIKTFRGDAQSLSERRMKMLEAFAKLGVDEARILRHLEKTSVEAIGLDDLVALRGLFTALKDGDTTVEEAFPEPEPPAGASAPTKTEEIKQRMKRGARRKREEDEPKPSEPDPAEQRAALVAAYEQGIDQAENEEELRYYHDSAHQNDQLGVTELARIDRRIAARSRALAAPGTLFE